MYNVGVFYLYWIMTSILVTIISAIFSWWFVRKMNEFRGNKIFVKRPYLFGAMVVILLIVIFVVGVIGISFIVAP